MQDRALSPTPTDAQREAYRLRAKTDLLWLAREVLGFKEMTDEVHGRMADLFLKKDPSKDLYDLDTVKRRLLLAPRGSFKTSMDQADIVQLILCYPNIRILIISGTQDLCVKMIAELKALFQSPKMQVLFPEYAPPPGTSRWGTDDSFTVLNRTVVKREPTVSISTIASVKAGSHVEYIKVDDAVNEINSATEIQCLKVVEAIDGLTPILEPQGFLDLVGTRYDRNDAYGVAMRREEQAQREAEEDGEPWEPELKTLVMPAWKVKDSYVPVYDTAGIPTYKASDVELLFSARHKFKWLYREYRRNPRMFANQYLCTVDDTFGDKNFDMPTIEKHVIPYQQVPKVGEIYLSFDLAGTVLRKDSDYCACTVGKLGVDGRLYIVDIIHQRLNANGQAAWIVELNRKWNPVRVYIEQSAGAQYLTYPIQDMARQAGTYVSLSWVVPSRMRGAKESRISYIPQLFNSDALFIANCCEHLQDLKEEAQDFPDGKHDDLLDSLAQLCLALKPGGVQQGPTAEEIKQMRERAIHEAFMAQMFGDDLPPAPSEPEPIKAGPCGYGLAS